MLLGAEDFPRHCPQHRLFGFRRYERGCLPGDRSPGGQFYLPDKEFRWICYLDLLLSTGGSDISADLPTSPQGPDHLFTSISHEVVGVWSLRILKYLEGLR